MSKKIIGILLTTAILFTMVTSAAINPSALETGNGIGDSLVKGSLSGPNVWTGNNAVFYTGYTSLWDNPVNISNVRGMWTWGQGSGKNTLSLEGTDAASQNANAYGGIGTSVKSVFTPYDFDISLAKTLKTGSTAKTGKYTNISFNAYYTIPYNSIETSSMSFWVKAEKALLITMVLVDANGIEMTSSEISVPAGVSVVEIPLSDFVLNSTNPITSSGLVIQQPRIYYKRLDNLSDATTVYVDKMGYYKSTRPSNLKQRTKSVTAYDFNNLNAIDGNWKPYNSALETLTLEKSTDKTTLPDSATTFWNFDAYNDISQSPLKVRNGYSCNISLETDTANVYGGIGQSLKMQRTSTQTPRIWNNSGFTITGDGIAFWVKSDQSMQLEITFAENWSVLVTKKVSVNAGENIVKIKYSELGNYTGGSLAQLSIEPIGPKPGTIWLDSFTRYFETGEKSNQNAYGGSGNSVHYTSSNLNKGGYNGFKLNFTKISLNGADGEKWTQDSTICIWMKSSRAMTLYLTGQDSEQYNDAAASWWKTGNYNIPAGESILRIPVSDFNICTVQGTRENKWDFIGSLNVCFPWNESAEPYSLYMDQISVEFPVIGDANDDDKIDIGDLISMKKLFADTKAPTRIKAVDVNADGQFDAFDLISFRKYLLGVETLAEKPFVASEANLLNTIYVTEPLSWGHDS